MDVSINEGVKKAHGYFNEGYFEDAVEAFSECLGSKPADPRIYYGRGMAYLKLKRWNLAIADFTKAKELNTEDTESWLGLALSLAMDNRIYEAIKIYEDLLTANPRLVRAYIQFALLYYRLGAINKGHQQLECALASRPTLDERRMIEGLKKDQLLLDKKRCYRPDFSALREESSQR